MGLLDTSWSRSILVYMSKILFIRFGVITISLYTTNLGILCPIWDSSLGEVQSKVIKVMSRLADDMKRLEELSLLLLKREV